MIRYDSRSDSDPFGTRPERRRHLLLSALLAPILATMPAGCGGDEDDAPRPSAGGIDAGKPQIIARADLHPTRGYSTAGTIRFVWNGETTRLEADVRELPPGAHAFHVHEFGDCSAPDAASAGDYFALADPQSPPERIVGNLGELGAADDGRGTLERTVPLARLAGPRSILGQSVVVHAGPNDPSAPPDGDAGSRIACGVIEAVSEGGSAPGQAVVGASPLGSVATASRLARAAHSLGWEGEAPRRRRDPEAPRSRSSSSSSLGSLPRSAPSACRPRQELAWPEHGAQGPRRLIEEHGDELRAACHRHFSG